VTSELLLRGWKFELLRSDRDLDGYDIVIDANGVQRHIQLKSQVMGGRSREIGAHVELATKPSGCIIWMTYDPLTLRPVSWRFFGGGPGERIKPLGDRIGKHSRGDKGFRPDQRIIKARDFDKVGSIEELVDRLFGRTNHEIAALLAHMAQQPEPNGGPWLHMAREGRFASIPHDCDWENSGDLAHLIDGYALLEQARGCDPSIFADEVLSVATQTGRWPGGPRDLWTALFLEHRRWRLADPHEPDAAQRALLDTLVHQLRESLAP